MKEKKNIVKSRNVLKLKSKRDEKTKENKTERNGMDGKTTKYILKKTEKHRKPRTKDRKKKTIFRVECCRVRTA